MAKMSSCFFRPAAPSTFIFLAISVRSPIRIPFSSFRFMHALPGTWVFSYRWKPPFSTWWKNARKALQWAVGYRRMCVDLVRKLKGYLSKTSPSIPDIEKTQLPGGRRFFAAEGMEAGGADRAGPRRFRLSGGDPGAPERREGESLQVGGPLPRRLPLLQELRLPRKTTKRLRGFLPDLVAASPRAGARDGDDSPHGGVPEPRREDADGFLDDPGGKPPPPRVDGRPDGDLPVGEKDRDAIRRVDPHPGPGAPRPEGVSLPLPPAGDIPVSDLEGKDGRRVDLFQRADRFRGKAKDLSQPFAAPTALHRIHAEKGVVGPRHGTKQGGLHEVRKRLHGAGRSFPFPRA